MIYGCVYVIVMYIKQNNDRVCLVHITRLTSGLRVRCVVKN